MNEFLLGLLEHGGTAGIILGLAYMYIRQLHTELRETEGKRVEDNKQMVSKLLELNDKWAETLNSQSELMESMKQTLTDLKQLAMDDHPRRR